MVDQLIKVFEQDTTLKKYVNGRVFWLKATEDIYPYITIIELGCEGGIFADNEMWTEQIHIGIEVWCKSDFFKIVKRIREILQELEFEYELGEDELDEKADCYKKKIVCSIEKII